ncbi:MAG: hypothetical protein QM778_35050 [Myxococcales bacterium]
MTRTRWVAVTVGVLLWSGLLGAWSWCCQAAAQEKRARVLVVDSETAGALSLRVSAELADVGLEPVRLTPSAIPDLAALGNLARAHDAELALCIEMKGSFARVWIVDRVTRKALRRDFALSGPGSGQKQDAAVGVVALGVVELVRASLLELDVLLPTHQVPSPSPKLINLAHEPARFSLQVSLGIHGGPGGAPPLAQFHLGGSIRLHSRLHAVLSAGLPIHPVRVSDSQGTATLWMGSFVAGLRVPLGEDDLAVRPHLGLGILGVLLTSDGAGKAPFEGRRSRTVTSGPAVELGARCALTQRVRLLLNLSAAYLVSPLVVAFADQDVARIGRPWLGATLGLDLAP